MSTGTGIAIPTPRKPIQAVGKFSLILEGDPTGGLHLSVRGSSKEVIRYGIATGGYVMGRHAIGTEEPEPEPQPAAARTRTRAKRPLSDAARANMAAGQKKRHEALLRKRQEGVSETTSSTPKRKPKTMAAGGSA